MTLPIIIMPERHWDADAKRALAGSLPLLAAQGYNTLCFEAPIDEDESTIIKGIASTIQFAQDRYAEAMPLLQRRGIDLNLSEMNYSDLEQLLLHYVSSKHSKAMALWFRELPGHVEKLELVKKAKHLNMAISGVDLTQEKLDPLRSINAQINIEMKLNQINLLDDERIAAFKMNLLDLQRKGRGVIFVVGQLHYERLVEVFSKENVLEDIIFAHPHSPRCLDSSIDDRPLKNMQHMPGLTLIEQEIHKPENNSTFSTLLNTTLKLKIDRYKPIDPTMISEWLKEKTGLAFDFYIRPSMHLDAYYPIAPEENAAIEITAKQLNAVGIQGSFTFFKGRETYCIPCINSDKVSNAIKNWGTTQG